jgi:hypothetical protein
MTDTKPIPPADPDNDDDDFVGDDPSTALPPLKA